MVILSGIEERIISQTPFVASGLGDAAPGVTGATSTTLRTPQGIAGTGPVE
jgi:hypothetical protein